MYAFRKPFAVGNYQGFVDIPGLSSIDYKSFLIISQVIGYTISKFLGIKFVSESSGHGRARRLLFLIATAELALIGFSVVPRPYNAICLFLNGLPLGMIWGLVFSYLEGRKTTEFLGAGLSASYIVASGAVKSVGKWVLDLGVPEAWMPAVTGALFFPVFVAGVSALSLIPPPTAEEEKLRTRRQPMDHQARSLFFKQFAPGLICLTAFYFFLTGYRDYRDNFAREIWDALGFSNSYAIFSSAEIPIAIFVLITLFSIMFIKNNRTAVAVIHALLIFGSVLIGTLTFLYQHQWISPVTWMIGVGAGLYLGYVPFGCVLFDRIIASTGFIGTAGFMIYVTDAFGYLGSVSVLLYKNLSDSSLSPYSFFIKFSYFTSAACAIGFLASFIYFHYFVSHQSHHSVKMLSTSRNFFQ